MRWVSPFLATPEALQRSADTSNRELYAVGKACVELQKLAAIPQSVYSLAGRLVGSKSGYLLLEVPNALVRGAFDALHEPGAELPPDLDAHITVIRPEELESIGGLDKITERGHFFKYQLGPVQAVNPQGWADYNKCWFIRVRSPELEKLRKSYGLSARPKDNEHAFHITVAVRKPTVLQENEVSKAAEVVAHIGGATGSGKTTLLNQIAQEHPELATADVDTFRENAIKKLKLSQGKNNVGAWTPEENAALHGKRQELLNQYLDKNKDKKVVLSGIDFEDKGQHGLDFPTRQRLMLDTGPMRSTWRAFWRDRDTKHRMGILETPNYYMYNRAVRRDFKDRGYDEASPEDIKKRISDYLTKASLDLTHEIASETGTTSPIPAVKQEAKKPRVRVFMPTDGHFLFQRSITDPNAYRVPGGGVEAGETNDQAIHREIHEEFGKTPGPGELKYLGADPRKPFPHEHYYLWRQHNLQPGTYQASNDDQEIIDLVREKAKGPNYWGPPPGHFGLPKHANWMDKLQPDGTLKERSGNDEGTKVIYLVRHGKTQMNNPDPEKDRIRGWKDVPLSAEGHVEAKRLGEMLKDVKPTHVYSSNLERTEDTANAIAQHSGRKVESDVCMRPWNVGKYQGQISAEVHPILADHAKNKPDEVLEGGESFNQFKARYLDFLRKCMEAVDAGEAGPLIIVVHFRNCKLTQAWIKANCSPSNEICEETFLRNDLPTGAILKLTKSGDNWQCKLEAAAGEEPGHGKASADSMGFISGPSLAPDATDKDDPESQPITDRPADIQGIETPAAQPTENKPKGTGRYTEKFADDFEPELVIDRPKGYQKTFNTSKGKITQTYPMDYGYYKGMINPEDQEDVDLFVGTGGPHYGRFHKGNMTTGTWQPDEHKYYHGLTTDELGQLKNWWAEGHDTGLIRDWTSFKDRQELINDIKARTVAAGSQKVARDLLSRSIAGRYGLTKQADNYRGLIDLEGVDEAKLPPVQVHGDMAHVYSNGELCSGLKITAASSAVPKLQAATKPGYYSVLFNNKNVHVIFSDKSFKLPRNNMNGSSGFSKAIEHARKHDIPDFYMHELGNTLWDNTEKTADEYIGHYKPAEKVTRQAFSYLPPKGDPEKFAQCETCRVWTGPESNTCLILGKEHVTGDMSCNYYQHGKPSISGAGKEHRILTPKQAGLVHRPVRCENCAFFDADGGYCELYEHLNDEFPEVFDLEKDVDAHGCCNFQTPKGPKVEEEAKHAALWYLNDELSKEKEASTNRISLTVIDPRKEKVAADLADVAKRVGLGAAGLGAAGLGASMLYQGWKKPGQSWLEQGHQLWKEPQNHKRLTQQLGDPATAGAVISMATKQPDLFRSLLTGDAVPGINQATQHQIRELTFGQQKEHMKSQPGDLMVSGTRSGLLGKLQPWITGSSAMHADVGGLPGGDWAGLWSTYAKHPKNTRAYSRNNPNVRVAPWDVVPEDRYRIGLRPRAGEHQPIDRKKFQEWLTKEKHPFGEERFAQIALNEFLPELSSASGHRLGAIGRYLSGSTQLKQIFAGAKMPQSYKKLIDQGYTPEHAAEVCSSFAAQAIKRVKPGLVPGRHDRYSPADIAALAEPDESYAVHQIELPQRLMHPDELAAEHRRVKWGPLLWRLPIAAGLLGGGGYLAHQALKSASARHDLECVKVKRRDKEVLICPHCGKEVEDKDLYRDKKGWIFHRPCFAKGKGSIKLSAFLGNSVPDRLRRIAETLDKRAFSGGLGSDPVSGVTGVTDPPRPTQHDGSSDAAHISHAGSLFDTMAGTAETQVPLDNVDVSYRTATPASVSSGLGNSTLDHSASPPDRGEAPGYQESTSILAQGRMHPTNNAAGAGQEFGSPSGEAGMSSPAASGGTGEEDLGEMSVDTNSSTPSYGQVPHLAGPSGPV